MRAPRLLLTAGLLVACGKPLTIAPGDAATPMGDGGPTADADAIAGDGGIPGTPCPASGPCLLVERAAQAVSIAVLNEYVYYTQYENSGAMWRVPVGGGGAAVVVPGLKLPSSVFAAADALYWVNEGDNSVARRPAAPPNNVATISSGSMLAGGQITALGTDAYWTEPAIGRTGVGQVHYSPGFAADQTFEMGLTLPTAIAVDTQYVYYAFTSAPKQQIARLDGTNRLPVVAADTFDDIRALAVSPTGVVVVAASDRVARAATFAGPFTNVYTMSSPAVAAVIDDDRNAVYSLTGDGSTWRSIAAATSQETKVPGCTEGRGLAQDAMYLYLACGTSIWRIPK